MARHCPVSNLRPPARQDGFSYMVALFALTLLALLATRALENARTSLQREKEAELLFAGQAYMVAIKLYYDNSPGTVRRYPPDLQALLLDERGVRVRHHLRRLYRDPMTANTEWGVIEATAGGIKGVYSRSQGAPIKKAGFPEALRTFGQARHYNDWRFVHESK
jgi:type II secretory pathway pseudopilin PulG